MRMAFEPPCGILPRLTKNRPATFETDALEIEISDEKEQAAHRIFCRVC